MSNRTQIKVKLTQAGSNALGGIGWATLDLAPDFSNRLSKDVNQLSDINTLLTDGVLPFSVPFSTVNDAAFIQFSSPLITDNYDTGIEARIVIDSHELPFDRIWITDKNTSSKTWDLEIRRSPKHWLEMASKKKLCTVDMGQATLTDTDVSDGWAAQLYVDGESPYRWIPADFGGWVDLAEPAQFTDPTTKRVWLEDLRPWISKVALLKQGFCEIGWTLEGQILSADWSTAQWDYLLNREYYTESRGGDFKLVGASPADDFTPNILVPAPIPFTTVDYDPGGNALPAGPLYFGGITNGLPFKGRWKFCLHATLENTSGSSNTIGFSVIEFDPSSGFPSGQVLADEPAVIEIPAGEKRVANFCLSVVLDVGQSAAVFVGASDSIKILKGYRISIEPDNKSFVRGDVFDLNKVINCDLILLDMFKGYVHQINGRVETDWLTKTVTVHPYRTVVINGDSVPGFIRDGSAPIDISESVVCDSIKMSRIKLDLTRYTRLQWADSTDAKVEKLMPPEPLFSRKITNAPELADKVTELKNPFYEPTMEWQPQILRYAKNIDQKTRPMAYLPVLWDNTDGNRSFVMGPRTLFFYGNVGQFDKTTGLSTSFFFEGSAVTVFGYAAQVPTLEFASGSEPGVNGNLAYGTTQSDQYVLFYLGYLQRQKRGTYLDALVMMNMNDWRAWDFRTPFFFQYEGRPVLALAESISDFAPVSETPTPVKFLAEPADTGCCDLPCSCRFKACDFYQDMGQYMTQDTLDQLSITSFKVNEIEQLDAPVDLGIIKIVEVSGKQFVSNLVDTLDSLGISYFTFRASTTDYPDKEDQRFFKIKWPACWSFEIIISDGDGEVYRYRDYDMAQQWFGGTWDAMGYGSNPVSEPQNCVITIEY